MKIIKASFDILTPLDGFEILKHIEFCGRTCYKSEDAITDNSCQDFVRKIIKNGHESVLEHFSFSVKFFIDRGLSHESVRHRLASFSQESTRYCDYSKGKFNNEITVIDIKDFFTYSQSFDIWFNCMLYCEDAYKKLRELGETSQIARSVLPNSLQTEIVVSANLREWRLILKQRTAKSAHPQMRDIMISLLNGLKILIPVVFDDIGVE